MWVDLPPYLLETEVWAASDHFFSSFSFLFLPDISNKTIFHQKPPEKKLVDLTLQQQKLVQD